MLADPVLFKWEGFKKEEGNTEKLKEPSKI